jgi:polysaccharide export outer membrane protein
MPKNRNRSALLLAAGLLVITPASGARAQQPSSDACRPSVIVAGAVRSPARFELRRRVRLSETLALAGGPTERAGDVVRVTRPEAAETYKLVLVSGDGENNDPYLRPGDIVTVEEVSRVHVSGSVQKPQAVRIVGELTLTQAIAAAGGLLPNSEKRRVVLTRYDAASGSKKRIDVDLKAVAKRSAADVQLLPNDIVYVPGKKSRSGCCSGVHALIVTLSADELPLRVVE